MNYWKCISESVGPIYTLGHNKIKWADFYRLSLVHEYINYWRNMIAVFINIDCVWCGSCTVGFFCAICMIIPHVKRCAVTVDSSCIYYIAVHACRVSFRNCRVLIKYGICWPHRNIYAFFSTTEMGKSKWLIQTHTRIFNMIHPFKMWLNWLLNHKRHPASISKLVIHCLKIIDSASPNSFICM